METSIVFLATFFVHCWASHIIVPLNTPSPVQYTYVDEYVARESAKATCNRQGSLLASPRTEGDWSVLKLVNADLPSPTSFEEFWLSGYALPPVQSRAFAWDDCSAMTLQHWGAMEPRTRDTNLCLTAVATAGQLFIHTSDCNISLPFVCQTSLPGCWFEERNSTKLSSYKKETNSPTNIDSCKDLCAYNRLCWAVTFASNGECLGETFPNSNQILSALFRLNPNTTSETGSVTFIKRCYEVPAIQETAETQLSSHTPSPCKTNFTSSEMSSVPFPAVSEATSVSEAAVATSTVASSCSSSAKPKSTETSSSRSSDENSIQREGASSAAHESKSELLPIVSPPLTEFVSYEKVSSRPFAAGETVVDNSIASTRVVTRSASPFPMADGGSSFLATEAVHLFETSALFSTAEEYSWTQTTGSTADDGMSNELFTSKPAVPHGITNFEGVSSALTATPATPIMDTSTTPALDSTTRTSPFPATGHGSVSPTMVAPARSRDETRLRPARLCACKCQARSARETEEQAARLQKELSVNKTDLSSRKRRLTSAPDARPSSQFSGSVAVSLLIGVALVVLVPDALQVLTWLKTRVRLGVS